MLEPFSRGFRMEICKLFALFLSHFSFLSGILSTPELPAVCAPADLKQNEWHSQETLTETLECSSKSYPYIT